MTRPIRSSSHRKEHKNRPTTYASTTPGEGLCHQSSTKLSTFEIINQEANSRVVLSDDDHVSGHTDAAYISTRT